MASRRLVWASARETLFGIPSDTASLERNYVLADDDLDLICTRRSAENRLGLAIHIALLRHPGQGWLDGAVFAHSQGRVQDRSNAAQQKRVMALNLVLAAIIYWNTSYMDKAADYLRRKGRLPDPELLRHVSPLGWDHIILTGDFNWNSGAAERTNARPLHLNPAKNRA